MLNDFLNFSLFFVFIVFIVFIVSSIIRLIYNIAHGIEKGVDYIIN